MVAKVVHVKSSTLSTPCKECSEILKSDHEWLELAINHYLKHGYKLEHVGQETEEGNHGPRQLTVAVLSK
jgi:hypothetical protein